ncbi:hypothetical protein [Candidatus Uabimicrobium sp. HlEnr_7]|uniref:hypothetical protein n=1 Tax=Candidatus Uabimicrobium helgolandensis TaxID=3095367 RepID=UPI00355761FF
MELTVPNPVNENQNSNKQDILDLLFPEDPPPEQRESVIFEKGMRCQHCGAKMVSGQSVCSLCGLQSI